MNRVIRTVGRIEYDEKKLATANTKIEGWIEKLHVDYTGRYVQKGEPLAEILQPGTGGDAAGVFEYPALGKPGSSGEG